MCVWLHHSQILAPFSEAKASPCKPSVHWKHTQALLRGNHIRSVPVVRTWRLPHKSSMNIDTMQQQKNKELSNRSKMTFVYSGKAWDVLWSHLSSIHRRFIRFIRFGGRTLISMIFHLDLASPHRTLAR